MKRVIGFSVILFVSLSTFSSQELMTKEAIESRIKPVGEVSISGEGAVQPIPVPQALGALSPDAGKKRYEASCSICHAAGVAGAPKLGDKAAWEPRIAQGIDVLLKNAINGIRAMPPRGTCMNCSDEELKLSIEYMTDSVK